MKVFKLTIAAETKTDDEAEQLIEDLITGIKQAWDRLTVIAVEETK